MQILTPHSILLNFKVLLKLDFLITIHLLKNSLFSILMSNDATNSSDNNILIYFNLYFNSFFTFFINSIFLTQFYQHAFQKLLLIKLFQFFEFQNFILPTWYDLKHLRLNKKFLHFLYQKLCKLLRFLISGLFLEYWRRKFLARIFEKYLWRE